MTSDIYNLNNEKVKSIELVDDIFGLAWNPDLVHFAYEVQRANARHTIAHAKDRSEVSGGGKKPWRQKGTGRARHGSSRSPIWTGGGATHGPLSIRDYSKKINKKQRRLALFSLLSKRLADNDIKVIDALNIAEAKTKAVAGNFKKLFDSKKQSLVIVGSPTNSNLSTAIRNIPGILSLSPESLNVGDILKYRHLVIEADALPVIAKHYLTK